MNEDDRLREGFAKLRSEDARRVPAFEGMWKPRRERSPWAVALPLASAAAAAAVLLVWCGVHEATRSRTELSAAPPAAAAPAPPDDPAPLDFLLDMPLSATLAQAPNFGTINLPGKNR